MSTQTIEVENNAVSVAENNNKTKKKEKPVKKSSNSSPSLNPVKRKKGFSLEKRRAVAGYIFVLPFIIGFILFMLYPFATSFQWSIAHPDSGVKTVEVNGEEKGRFVIEGYVGFRNYGTLIAEDYDFSKAILDTMQRTFLWTPFIIVFSLMIAILLNKKIKFRGGFRVIYFLPVLLGTGLVLSKLSGDAEAGTGLTSMLTIPNGLLNMIAYVFNNLEISTFLMTLLSNIVNMFWKMGVQIVIFLSGLQGISDSYYEAAKVDSANWWDMLWKITIPMLSPMILLNTIYTIIDSFRDESNQIVAYVLALYAKADWIKVSVSGWIYFGITLILLGIVFLITRRMVFYEK